MVTSKAAGKLTVRRPSSVPTVEASRLRASPPVNGVPDGPGATSLAINPRGSRADGLAAWAAQRLAPRWDPCVGPHKDLARAAATARDLEPGELRPRAPMRRYHGGPWSGPPEVPRKGGYPADAQTRSSGSPQKHTSLRVARNFVQIEARSGEFRGGPHRRDAAPSFDAGETSWKPQRRLW